MTTPAENTAENRAASHEIARMWSGGWQRFVFPSVWLVYLGEAFSGVHAHNTGVAAIVGYAIVVAFGIVYIAALPVGSRQAGERFWLLYGIGLALTVLECFFAHEDALVFLVYLAVLTVAAKQRWSIGVVGLYAVIYVAVPPLVRPWHHGPDWSGALAVVLVGFAMFGFFHVIDSNRALAAARAEVARLAAENERSRIARDLHDLLGHSLTTITVKAGLARRLAERGDERSFTEISEVETLARRTLGDVRAAVAGHREVTLAGELATAREVLRAAAVAAELPGSVDVVDASLSELFGWVVREGITNIVRHAHADTCRVDLGPRWIEISDTGVGAASPGSGSGLLGLRERVAAAGGHLHAGPTASGFAVRVEVPVPTPSAQRSRPDARVLSVPTVADGGA